MHPEYVGVLQLQEKMASLRIAREPTSLQLNIIYSLVYKSSPNEVKTMIFKLTCTELLLQ